MSQNNLYPSSSPYRDTEIFNQKYLDFMTFRPIPSLPSDVLYTLPEVYQYRPDLLAYDLYVTVDCGGSLLLEILIV